jgi:excisionase family DNA binding protein
MTTASLPALLTTDDVAHWLGVPRRRVLAMVRDGSIPHVKLPSGDIAYSAEALAGWIQTHSTGEEVTRA